MRGVWVRAAGLLLLAALLFGAVLLGDAPDPSVLVAALAALLCAGVGAAGRPRPAATPIVAARARRRALAGRAVPRQRDPDAAGHTRSRAPSDLLPAV